MNLQKHTEETKLDLQIAPLIDVVFLLLIYFMVTAALIKKEGDIAFMLPAQVPPEAVQMLPIEVQIQITVDGIVEVDGMRFAAEDETLMEMASQLDGLKAMAKSQGAEFFVSIQPHRNVEHKRIIQVMDACAAAEVKSLTFSQSL